LPRIFLGSAWKEKDTKLRKYIGQLLVPFLYDVNYHSHIAFFKNVFHMLFCRRRYAFFCGSVHRERISVLMAASFEGQVERRAVTVACSACSSLWVSKQIIKMKNSF